MSTHNVDRKDLKRPDQFMESVTKMFNEFSKHTRGILFLGVLVLALGAGAFFWMSRSQSQATEAMNALFIADKAVEDAMTKILAANAPAADAEKAEKGADAKAAKSKAAPKPVKPVKPVKVDVDTQLSDAVKKYHEVVGKYPRTRAAFEARLKLGDLYIRNAQPAKAIPLLETAAENPPNTFEKAMVLVALGSALESSGKFSDAIKVYEKSSLLGQANLKGEVLLGIARSWESMSDVAKAKAAYDQVISQLPNTDYSKTAELSKATLESAQPSAPSKQ